MALQAVAIELVGLDVRGRGERDAAREQRAEQVAENHRIGDVRDRELVEANDPRLGRELVRERVERLLAVAKALQALVHVGHEAMKVPA